MISISLALPFFGSEWIAEQMMGLSIRSNDTAIVLASALFARDLGLGVGHFAAAKFRSERFARTMALVNFLEMLGIALYIPSAWKVFLPFGVLDLAAILALPGYEDAPDKERKE